MRFSTLVLLYIFYMSHVQGQESHDISLETGEGKIYGTLLLPDPEETPPVVLIIAGSGPTDRDGNNPMMKNNALKMLAECLQTEGIATVRYDKRGIAASQSAGLNEIDLRFEHYVSDAMQWIETLRSDVRFGEIIVLGHSEGSLIGMLAASEGGADRYISIAGPGQPAADIIRTQLESQPDFVKTQSFPILEAMEKGDTVEEVPVLLNALFRPSVQPYLISWFKYDPCTEIARLDMPVLIVQGTTDIQVTEKDAKSLLEAQPKARLEVLKDMNHILKTSSADRSMNLATYSDPDLDLHDGLLPVLIDFIKT